MKQLFFVFLRKKISTGRYSIQKSDFFPFPEIANDMQKRAEQMAAYIMHKQDGTAVN